MLITPRPTKLDPVAIAVQLIKDHSLSFISYPDHNKFAHFLISDRELGKSRGLQDVELAKSITRSITELDKGAANWRKHGPGAMNYYDSIAFRAIDGRNPSAGIVCSYHASQVIHESIERLNWAKNDGALSLQVLWHLSQHSTESCCPVLFNCVPITYQGFDTMASAIYVVGG
jgi:hypothetical protein